MGMRTQFVLGRKGTWVLLSMVIIGTPLLWLALHDQDPIEEKALAAQVSSRDSRPKRSADSDSSGGRLAVARSLYMERRRQDDPEVNLSEFKEQVATLNLKQAVALIDELEAREDYRGELEDYLMPLYLHWADLDPRGAWRAHASEMLVLETLDVGGRSWWVERSAEVLRIWSRSNAKQALIEYTDLVRVLRERPEVAGVLNHPPWWPDLHEVFENAAKELKHNTPELLREIDDDTDYAIGMGHWACFEMRSGSHPNDVQQRLNEELASYVESHENSSIEGLRRWTDYHLARGWFAADPAAAMAWYEQAYSREKVYDFLSGIEDEGMWGQPEAVRSFLRGFRPADRDVWIQDYLLPGQFVRTTNLDLLLLVQDADVQYKILTIAAADVSSVKLAESIQRVANSSLLSEEQKAEVNRMGLATNIESGGDRGEQRR